MTLLEQIKADEMLLRWARGSIRYNTLRKHQAVDFRAKVKHLFPDVTIAQCKSALKEIEKQDNEIEL